jgi:hypothetical protein
MSPMMSNSFLIDEKQTNIVIVEHVLRGLKLHLAVLQSAYKNITLLSGCFTLQLFLLQLHHLHHSTPSQLPPFTLSHLHQSTPSTLSPLLVNTLYSLTCISQHPLLSHLHQSTPSTLSPASVNTLYSLTCTSQLPLLSHLHQSTPSTLSPAPVNTHYSFTCTSQHPQHYTICPNIASIQLAHPSLPPASHSMSSSVILHISPVNNLHRTQVFKFCNKSSSNSISTNNDSCIHKKLATK